MQVVASIIAENNPSLWQTSDVGVPNTDWRLHYADNEIEDAAGRGDSSMVLQAVTAAASV